MSDQPPTAAVAIIRMVAMLLLSGGLVHGQGAPSFSTQPRSASACAGDFLHLVAVVAGAEPLDYQWRLQGFPIPGARGAELFLTDIQPTEVGNYDLVVTNPFGAVTSAVAVVTVGERAVIARQPEDITVMRGGTAAFSVSATGSPAPTYQWQRAGEPLAGANAATLTITNAQASHSGVYNVVVSNFCGAVVSRTVALVVNGPVAIAQQPQSQTNCLGSFALLSVGASGTEPLSFQWRFQGRSIAGATGPLFILSDLQADAEGAYDVVITNALNAVTSAVAAVTVNLPPAISTPPAGISVTNGQRAVLSVVATGKPAPTYQWRRNGLEIPGAVASTYTIVAAQASDAGSYEVIVSNACNQVLSAPVTVVFGREAPVVVTRPGDIAGGGLSACVGDSLRITGRVTGTEPLAYQWRFNGTAIPGSTGPDLFLADVRLTETGDFDFVVTNAFGAATSRVAQVMIGLPPMITSEPVGIAVTRGRPAQLSVAASGTPQPAYQWRRNGVAITGATAATFALTAAQTDDAGGYDVVVANRCGVATSQSVRLVVNGPVEISRHPLPVSDCAGASTVLSVAAGGTEPLSYQWRFNGQVIPGATGPQFNFDALESADAGGYDVVITNVVNAVTSAVAVVSVQLPAAISAPPVGISVTNGQRAVFSVSATGNPAPTYQWRRDGVDIPGATGTNYVIAAARAGDEVSYFEVVVSNACRVAVSPQVRLRFVGPVTIVRQPVDQHLVRGNPLFFSAETLGSEPVVFEWRFNGTPISGAVGPALFLGEFDASQAGRYEVVVSNSVNVVTSRVALAAVAIAPAVTLQPTNQTALAGATVTMVAQASGTEPLSYQWQKNGADLGNETNRSLTLSSVAAGDAGVYRLLVANLAGRTNTADAALTVLTPPTITLQPTNQTVVLGGDVQLAAQAVGPGLLSYQWRKAGAPLLNATNAILALSRVQANQAGSYTVVVANGDGSVTSRVANVAVLVPPTITRQPANRTVPPGTIVSFAVEAAGSGPLYYQWEKDGVELRGQTNATLLLGAVQTNQSGLYRVVARNLAGSEPSQVASLVVTRLPIIQQPPLTQAALLGMMANFLVIATGEGPFTYQWKRDGRVIAGATADTYSIAQVRTNDSGTYSVSVSNPYGMVDSPAAELRVVSRSVRLGHVSLTNSLAGGSVLIPVTLGAVGGESAVTFTVAYNPEGLTFAGVSNRVGTATLTTSNSTAAGVITVRSSLPAGQNFAAGETPIADLAFAVAPPTNQVALPLLFAGDNAGNQVVDAGGNVLPAAFVAGSLVLKQPVSSVPSPANLLFGETLRIVVPAQAAGMSYLRVLVAGLGTDSRGRPITLYNAVGQLDGVPYVLFPAPVTPGQVVDLALEYYVADRTTIPRPTLVVETVTMGLPSVPAEAAVLDIDRRAFVAGSFVVDFSTVAGRQYYIQYSGFPTGPWQTSFPAVTGTGSRMQWVDTGPPRTASKPMETPQRYYRILEAR